MANLMDGLKKCIHDAVDLASQEGADIIHKEHLDRAIEKGNLFKRRKF
jgi:hypothetical protein